MHVYTLCITTQTDDSLYWHIISAKIFDKHMSLFEPLFCQRVSDVLRIKL